jgi:MFS family permease
LFYIPGALGGSFVSDWIGPRYALAIGVFAQAVVGFIMAGLYNTLATPAHIAGFVVVYGIFLSLGELGPGDNIGLIASKTSATGIRGQYYAIAAAFGKIGAFTGTYAFKAIAKAGSDNENFQNPFFVSSTFCIVSGLLTLFCLPHIGQDTITFEDIRFREYLERHGWDTRQLGLLKGESVESHEAAMAAKTQDNEYQETKDVNEKKVATEATATTEVAQ